MKKEMHFILDELIFKKHNDIDMVEDFMIFNDNFFTQTRVNLSEEEIFITDLYKTSFV
jgi:hypothetical protein